MGLTEATTVLIHKLHNSAPWRTGPYYTRAYIFVKTNDDLMTGGIPIISGK